MYVGQEDDPTPPFTIEDESFVFHNQEKLNVPTVQIYTFTTNISLQSLSSDTVDSTKRENEDDFYPNERDLRKFKV